jgi:hypothetical protein
MYKKSCFDGFLENPGITFRPSVYSRRCQCSRSRLSLGEMCKIVFFLPLVFYFYWALMSGVLSVGIGFRAAGGAFNKKGAIPGLKPETAPVGSQFKGSSRSLFS